jgi:hypothetical protein
MPGNMAGVTTIGGGDDDATAGATGGGVVTRGDGFEHATMQPRQTTLLRIAAPYTHFFA